MEPIMIKENARCGTRGVKLSKTAATSTDCAALAEGEGATAFTLGHGGFHGVCYAETLNVDKALLDKWDANKADPECPVGAWQEDPNFDFYALYDPDDYMLVH